MAVWSRPTIQAASSSGQTLRLRVDLTDPQVMLHIVEQDLSVEGELTKLMRRYLPGDEQVSLAALSEGLAARGPFEEFGTPLRLDRLKLLLAGLFQKRELLTPAGLKEFVREGGLHYEMKLSKAAAGDPAQLSQIADRDLKGLLLGALDELNKSVARAIYGR